MIQSQGSNENTPARGLFWASTLFYILIAFEFFYMASPFAAYFYAVYGPGLDSLQEFGLSGWLLWFFLPHVVAETRSSLINNLQVSGGILFCLGLVGFVIAAFQVYRAKLQKSDAVMGGLYRYIRHPQYAALIVASLGMLLIWPRFLVLLSTITMIFAYLVLARTEESICMRKYLGYQGYMTRTGGFLPRNWMPFQIPRIQNKWLRVIAWAAAFSAVAGLAILLAFGVRAWVTKSLYTHETNEGTYLSVVAIPDSDLASVANIARSAPEAKRLIEAMQPNGKLLAFVLPTEMYISEIPMFLPVDQHFGHSIPKNRAPKRYKVIFTQAIFPEGGSPVGSNIVASAVHKTALIEVHVNLLTQSVETTYPPPAKPFYPNVQVPIF